LTDGSNFRSEFKGGGVLVDELVDDVQVCECLVREMVGP